MERVYLDNAATTPMAEEVIESIYQVMKNEFGNPSSLHSFGRSTKAIIENSRREIGKLIGAEAKEIIFTSGGTEADNMAIICSVRDLGIERIISTCIEHHAVEHSLDNVKNNLSCEIVHVKIDEKGNVDFNHLEELLKENKKTLVSLMHANNEIGTLLPLEKVSLLCRQYKAYFHSDTVQTMGHIPIDLKKLDIDFITCAAHKFHGPKGIGFLYVNKNLKIKPFIEGGSQERGMRGGTENLTGIVGLTKALEIACADIEKDEKYIQSLKNYMIEELKKKIKDLSFNGEISNEKSLCTILNVSLPNFSKQEMLLFLMDLEGVACSGGSACTAGANTGSHVLRGIQSNQRPNIRFSFSRYTTKNEINFAIEKLVKVFES